MNRKVIIIVSIIVAAIVGIIFILWLVVRTSPPSSVTTNGELQITGRNNTIVTTKDFIKTAPKYDRAVVIYADSNYTIQYDTSLQGFQITFTVPTVQELNRVRSEAESKLLDTLGVPQSSACQLVVTEVIAQADLLGFPNTTYYLSFCPGEDSFPQPTSQNQNIR